jgi:hypothetical protein
VRLVHWKLLDGERGVNLGKSADRIVLPCVLHKLEKVGKSWTGFGDPGAVTRSVRDAEDLCPTILVGDFIIWAITVETFPYRM